MDPGIPHILAQLKEQEAEEQELLESLRDLPASAKIEPALQAFIAMQRQPVYEECWRIMMRKDANLPKRKALD